MLVQRYVKTPLLLDGKKFDLRLYVLIKGYDPVEAYLADEGLVRVCTQNYRMPNPQNMKNIMNSIGKHEENARRREREREKQGKMVSTCVCLHVSSCL